MKGRLAIPIHSPTGELLAYAGRATNPTAPLADRYKYPENFSKEIELYNLHGAVASVDFENLGLFLVPDFVDVWRFYEAGFENVAAVMDEGLSQEQVALMVSTFTVGVRITLLHLDTLAVAELVPLFHVRVVDADPGDPKEALLRVFRPGQ